MPDSAGAAVRGLAAILVTALVAAILLALGGFDPIEAAGALFTGALGGRQAILSVTLVRSVPLILTGLAVALAFRAGVWNIGAEGQLYAGAVVGVWVALTFDSLPAPILLPTVMAASAVAGAAWAAVPAVMRLRMGVGEVITTILMNFVGIHLAAYMIHGPLQERRGVFAQTDLIPEAARLPTLAPDIRLHLGFVVAVVLAAGLAVFFSRSRLGFQLRAVGASPDVARVGGGIRTPRVLAIAFLGSGAIAGLAGGIEVSGVTWALYEGLSPGWGYTAIAVALLAGLRPLAVVGTGILFGVLAAGAAAMQRDAGIPAVWAGVVEALIILAVLAIERSRPRGVRVEAGPGEPAPTATAGAVEPGGADG